MERGPDSLIMMVRRTAVRNAWRDVVLGFAVHLVYSVSWRLGHLHSCAGLNSRLGTKCIKGANLRTRERSQRTVPAQREQNGKRAIPCIQLNAITFPVVSQLKFSVFPCCRNQSSS